MTPKQRAEANEKTIAEVCKLSADHFHQLNKFIADLKAGKNCRRCNVPDSVPTPQKLTIHPGTGQAF